MAIAAIVISLLSLPISAWSILTSRKSIRRAKETIRLVEASDHRTSVRE